MSILTLCITECVRVLIDIHAHGGGNPFYSIVMILKPMYVSGRPSYIAQEGIFISF